MDTMNSIEYSKVFITGCDSKTRWMLPWWKENFYKHNPDAHVHVYDFDKAFVGDKGWFKKPRAMYEASKKARCVCWIDSDVEIKANIEDIFDYVEPNKLAMVEDQPWTTRRGERWHNSGVVAFQGTPKILTDWVTATAYVDQQSNPMYGDQDVLHEIVRQDMKRLIHITDLPKTYNTLRLDIGDGTIPKTIKMMHWTGPKGKEIIRSMINE